MSELLSMFRCGKKSLGCDRFRAPAILYLVTWPKNTASRAKVPEHQNLCERISDLPSQLDHRLDCPPQKITELWEEIEGAIADWDARNPECNSDSYL